jgi:hypothetical protein
VGFASDLSLGRRRVVEQKPDGIEHGFQLTIVNSYPILQRGESPCQVVLRNHQAAHTHEGAHNLHARLHGDWGIEHAGEHDGTVFGESVRQVPSPTSRL